MENKIEVCFWDSLFITLLLWWKGTSLCRESICTCHLFVHMWFYIQLKDKWTNFLWNWISAAHHLFGHLSVSWFINTTYLQRALTHVFIHHLDSMVPVDKQKSQLAVLTGRFVISLSRKTFPISPSFTHSGIWKLPRCFKNSYLVNELSSNSLLNSYYAHIFLVICRQAQWSRKCSSHYKLIYEPSKNNSKFLCPSKAYT